MITDAVQKPPLSGVTPLCVPVIHECVGTSKKTDSPNGTADVIIWKGAETIENLQLQSAAKIQVPRDMEADPNSSTWAVELTGTPDQTAKAEKLIHEVLSEVLYLLIK